MPYPARDRLTDVHRDLLERWRVRMNLVGPGPVDEHFDDVGRAVAPLTLTGTWADLGSGAGFPGLVMAARYPELAVDLVESRQKRCAFLSEVVSRSGAGGIRVVEGRLEGLPDHAYDGITGRALAAPDELLVHARRLLRPGGHVLLFLNHDVPVPAASDFAEVLVHAYPFGGRTRTAALFAWQEH